MPPATEVHQEQVHHYQRGHHETTIHCVLQDRKVGLTICLDESRLHLDSSHRPVCLVDQTLSNGMDIVTRDHLDQHHPIHLALIAAQAILLDTLLSGLLMRLTNRITDCLDQPNVLVCWIGMKERPEGNTNHEQGTKKEGTTSARLDQNVNRALRGTLVMRESMPEQEESIHDLKGQKDLRGQIGNTASLCLIIQIVLNVPIGLSEETMQRHRAEETPPHLAGMRLQLRLPRASTPNEQHSFRGLKSRVLECRSAVKPKNEIGPHDQPRRGAKMIANMLRGVKEKTDRKESLKHKAEMRPRHRHQCQQEILLPLVRLEIVVVHLWTCRTAVLNKKAHIDRRLDQNAHKMPSHLLDPDPDHRISPSEPTNQHLPHQGHHHRIANHLLVQVVQVVTAGMHLMQSSPRHHPEELTQLVSTQIVSIISLPPQQINLVINDRRLCKHRRLLDHAETIVQLHQQVQQYHHQALVVHHLVRRLNFQVKAMVVAVDIQSTL